MTSKALTLWCRHKKHLSKKLIIWETLFSFTYSFLNSLFMTVISFKRISCTDWWGPKKWFSLKTNKQTKSLFTKHAKGECVGATAELAECRSVTEQVPKTSYNAKTETMKFANPLYFQVLRQYMWMLRLPLASKPEPAIKQPECYSNWIHDHFSFSTFFILLF